MPRIDQFKTSTKKGSHSYFEILNTKINIPNQEDKKMLTEATVPVPLYSEAVWQNGELSITLKELGKRSCCWKVIKKTRSEFAPEDNKILINKYW